MREKWKGIKGWDDYEVSNKGRVRSLKNGSKNPYIMKPITQTSGYSCVHLKNNGTMKTARIHRLVAEAFLPNDNNKEHVNHIDGNKSNNDISNLEWATAGENNNHAWRTGLKTPSGEKPVRIVETGEVFKSANECARMIHGHEADISKCCCGIRPTHLGFHFEYV